MQNNIVIGRILRVTMRGPVGSPQMQLHIPGNLRFTDLQPSAQKIGPAQTIPAARI